MKLTRRRNGGLRIKASPSRPYVFPTLPSPLYMRKIPGLLLALLASRAGAEDACRYLAYEGFNYPTNTPLHSLPGGPGWERSWELQNESADVPGYQINGIGSLIDNSVVTEGLFASGGKAYLTAGRKLDLSSSGPFADYLSGGSIAH